MEPVQSKAVEEEEDLVAAMSIRGGPAPQTPEEAGGIRARVGGRVVGGVRGRGGDVRPDEQAEDDRRADGGDGDGLPEPVHAPRTGAVGMCLRATGRGGGGRARPGAGGGAR